MSSRTPERPRPVFLAIGHLSGVKRADAEQYVRGIILRHASAPEAAGYYLLRTESGFAYEIQEGGDGRAYLPAALARLRANPDKGVRVALAGRAAEIRMTEQGPVSTLLPEGAEGEAESVEPGPKLVPYEKDRSRLLIAAVAAFCASAAALVSALAVGSLAASRPASGPGGALAVDSLPIRHWPAQVAEGEYVSALRFDGARWSVERKPAPEGSLETFESFAARMEGSGAR